MQMLTGIRLLQINSVARNRALIPEEAVLVNTVQVTGAVVVAINVNEAVALGHLTRGEGHQIDGAPGGVEPNSGAPSSSTARRSCVMWWSRR